MEFNYKDDKILINIEFQIASEGRELRGGQGAHWSSQAHWQELCFAVLCVQYVLCLLHGLLWDSIMELVAKTYTSDLETPFLQQ